ncbi:uncharacterized protein PRCAT00002071001 [Priceomyces carsonii]|uniref:uncharacterized protein n=1 Tax=Priceomyces carsonii TaxID=28549 RepID=UPI002ED9B7A6|nr:unnamed protein product [Priceomyces carsonii]
MKIKSQNIYISLIEFKDLKTNQYRRVRYLVEAMAVRNSTTFSESMLPSARESISNISFASAILWFALWIGFKLLDWFILCLPTIVLNLFSINFDIKLSMASLMGIFLVLMMFCYVLLRYKYLTGFSKNTTPEGEKPKKNLDLVGSVTKRKNPKSKSSNYLKEFLSAIKVFGYLERPVFHELTKNMTTQKISKDEIICLDENLGFLMVVDGTLQIFTKLEEGTKPQYLNGGDDDYEKDGILVIGDERYHLLNEVISGSPLGNLINTLDLFKPKFWRSNSALNSNYSFSGPASPSRSYLSPDTTGVSPFDNLRLDPLIMFKLALDSLPDIVARPKSGDGNDGATIAIIPALAFQAVQAMHPKATSHIVTIVLTRLYKVTMSTIHNYLGLTREIIESEIRLNDIDENENTLPSYLYEGVMKRFYGNQGTSVMKRLGSYQIPELKKTSSSIGILDKGKSRYVALDSRSKSTHPGDLLSSVPLSRRPEIYQSPTADLESSPASRPRTRSFTNIKLTTPTDTKRNDSPSDRLKSIKDRTFSDEREETEETSLRIAIVENVFKLLGIYDIFDILDDFRKATSDHSSPSSSMVGLSSLLSGGKLGYGHYDPTASFLRSDSINSLASSLGKGSASNNPKFYKTLNLSQLSTINSRGSNADQIQRILNQDRIRSNGPGMLSLEDIYRNIKSEFSKALDIKYIPPNTTLVEQNSFNSGLYYVIDGSLDVLYRLVNDDSKSKKLYTVKSGGLAGYLTSIVGFRSLVLIRTSQEKGVIAAHISKSNYSKLMDKFYFLQLPVASKLKSLLSKQILTIDYALEWCHIPAGQVLCSQGDLANGFHIVLSGRFRVIRYNKPDDTEDGAHFHDYNNNLIDESSNKKHLHGKAKDNYEVLGEYGHGESIGELEVLTASRRTNSLVAVRDSETARIPRTLFELLSLHNSSIMVKVSRIVASKVLSKENSYDERSRMASSQPTTSQSETSTDFKTITILPTVDGLPVRAFADRLMSAMKEIGRKVIALDQASTLIHLGRHAFDDRLAHLKLSGYFAYLEEEYETIVYVCDTPIKSNWTATCISQGDCILLLADADDEETAANVGDYERLLLKLKTTARADLCLIHSDKYVQPKSTRIWLRNRLWVHWHHHIQMEIKKSKHEEHKKVASIISDIAAKISNKTNPNIKMKLENVKSKAVDSLNKLNLRLHRREQHFKAGQLHKNDFLRLARILSNEAVGLVLGGGGSRGISHVGVVMALEKHGIPIDIIGGTSIGSFVGGLYAKEYNLVSIYGKVKKFSHRISSWWRLVFDLTYPVTSYLTGYEFNRGIWKVFGFSEIEDFWIKYFCNSTNITNSTMEIHETGYLWRFIRASMSLAGLLPPIAFNGSMLLDGGYLDNLPVMEMKKKGAKYIIAVDVGSVDDRTPMDYGDTLSGFWVLLNRWNPFSKHPNVPNMMDIQMRLAYVASVNALELAKKTPGVIYMRPPIDDYATLDFAKFEEIFHVGFAYADTILTEFKTYGKLPPIAGLVDKSKVKIGDSEKRLYRRNSI